MTIEDIFAVTTAMKADIENLSIDDLKSEMATNPDLLLIDIREVQELIDLGTIPTAKHCARGMLEFWASPASPIIANISKRIGGRLFFALEVDAAS